MAEAGGAYNLRARRMTAEVTGRASVPLCSTTLDTGTIGTSAIVTTTTNVGLYNMNTTVTRLRL